MKDKFRLLPSPCSALPAAAIQVLWTAWALITSICTQIPEQGGRLIRLALYPVAIADKLFNETGPACLILKITDVAEYL